jgi:hypothetical protein
MEGTAALRIFTTDTSSLIFFAEDTDRAVGGALVVMLKECGSVRFI